MTVMRTFKNKNYTVMSNTHLRDKNLSLKAKGLLSVMLSLPDNWNYSIAGLVAICKENETAIKSALNELKENGYLIVNKLKTSKATKGKIGYEYLIFETPDKEEQEKLMKQSQEGDFQGVGFLGVEIQEVENQGQLNTNKYITNKLNKENKDKKDKEDIGLSSDSLPSSSNQKIKEPTQEEMDNQVEKAIGKIHPCTKYLISKGLIEKDDAYIPNYNYIFYEALEQYDFELVRDVNNYVVSKMLKSDTPIKDKLSYFKYSFNSELEKMYKRRNMTLEEMNDWLSTPAIAQKEENKVPFYNWLEN